MDVQLSNWVIMQILNRINAEIKSRIVAGEEIAPPPKTAIAGPEFFGFNVREVPPSSQLTPDTLSSN